MTGLTHTNLGNILKTYAIVNSKVNYCQGMNFLAGYLFLSLDNKEELAFGTMREVIERFNMILLFQKEQPMLKLMFYQLDRLIAIYLPDLHMHFKDETINCSYFSSSFFITLFSSIMQSQKSFENGWKIQRIWDHFLLVSNISHFYFAERMENYFQNMFAHSENIRGGFAWNEFRVNAG
jgi:hypothetical protein